MASYPTFGLEGWDDELKAYIDDADTAVADAAQIAASNAESAANAYTDGVAAAIDPVPSGGTTGQVLSKNSNADGDTGWVTPTVGLTSIADDSITMAKLADLAEARVIGRAAGAGTGDPVALTGAQVRTIANVADGATANSTDAYLRNLANATGLLPIANAEEKSVRFITKVGGVWEDRPTSRQDVHVIAFGAAPGPATATYPAVNGLYVDLDFWIQL